MNSVMAKKEDNTIELKVAIPWEEVKKTREEVVEEAAKASNLSGFRKGKAPKKLVEKTLDQEKIREEVLKKMLPKAYIEAVKKHGITPIINPKIHVEKLDDDKDWEFTAITCEAPIVDLDNYKENVQKITAKSKIIVPGKEQQKPNFEEIMKTILESVKVKIPQILIDHEVERLLAQTLDEIKRLGLTLDQYLASTGKNPQVLRDDYAKKAENDLKLEFTLQQIAEEEKITVDEKEIDEAINKAKDENERKNLEANRYLLANILRQQKTLDFIKNL
ncbi:hypothetical protein C4559_04670 [Candidatus Microgenomates bacterium]|nr:MAG: hypothetical protein C4559_04670 [Candidatus Microgenomates bacterium]